MIRTLLRRTYEVPIKVGQMVHHTSLGWGKVTFISPNEYTMCPIKVHFEHKEKFISFTVTGKEFLTQATPVIDFGAKLVPTPTPKSKGKVAEIMEDLEFLREQKPELGIGPVSYNGGNRTFTIKLI